MRRAESREEGIDGEIREEREEVDEEREGVDEGRGGSSRMLNAKDGSLAIFHLLNVEDYITH